MPLVAVPLKTSVESWSLRRLCRVVAMRPLLLALLLLLLTPALAALDLPPELGPTIAAPSAADPAADYTVTQVAAIAKGFKAPTQIKVAFRLPDEALAVGKVYHATVTWTVDKSFHLNGQLPGSPETPFCTLRLIGTHIEAGPVSYSGRLQTAEFEGVAPTYYEREVTADLPFRLKRSATGVASANVGARLEIDSSYCSEANGTCYNDIVTPTRGQRYTVNFQRAATPPPAQDEAFPAPRIPPLAPFGAPPPPDKEPAPVDGGTAAPAANPSTPGGQTGGEPVVGATSSPTLPASVAPQGLWSILVADLEAGEKVRALYDQGGLFMLLLFVGLSGLIATALPCTYPLIPITSRILGARVAGREPQPGDPTRGDAFAASLFYMLGLTLIYGAIGAAGASASLLLTDLNNAAWFNIAIALLFAVLALGMFGLFEIKMPAFIANKLGGGPAAPGARPHGLFSNALRGLNMGVLAAVLAGACTAPVMIAALLLVGKLELGPVKGFLILAPFGFGFGLPYFLLTNFITRLPAPGQWMELVKILFGTLILLTGFYYWDKTVPNLTVYYLALGVALLAVGIAFGALDRLEAPVPASQRVRQVATVALVIAGGYFLVAGLRHSLAADLQPPAAGAQPAASQVAWESYQSYDPEKPDASGRPVFIFFHSPSCYYCNKMLATGFQDPAVIALTKKIRMIDADAHYGSEKLDALQEHYDYQSQPHNVFLNAAQQPAWGERSLVRGYIDTAGLKQRFEALLAP